MSKAAVKQNNGFVMRSYAFFGARNGRKPSRLETLLEGLVFSFGRGETPFSMGYATICERYNISKATVARKLSCLRKEGRIERERHGGRASAYTYVYDVPSDAHIRTEEIFLTNKFNVYGVERFLTPSEVDVLSLIYTHTRNEKKKRFEGSERDISRILGLRVETVHRAIYALFSADLICRESKGVNGYTEKTIFKAKIKKLRAVERIERKKEKANAQRVFVSAETEAANAKAERERFYSKRREEAQNRADHYLKLAQSSADFRKIDKRLHTIELDLAKAELKNPQELPRLHNEKQSLRFERARILRTMNLSEELLKPRWACSKCSDTGHLPDRRACDCYKPPQGGAR